MGLNGRMDKRLPYRKLRYGVAAAALALGLGAAAVVPAVTAATVADAPELKKPILKKPAKGVKVFVDAERITYDGKTKIGIATGKVEIVYGPYTLTATRVVYDEVHNTFKANGSVVVREPNDNVLEADRATMWNHFRDGFAHHLRALLTNDATITANYARMYENGITIYQRASYTACKACINGEGKPVWRIDADTAKHDKNTHTIYYKDASLKIGDVPVFYTPYLSYPDPTVKRRSGFLWANAQYKSTYGLGVTVPYFWAPAPDWDLTFSPMLTTKQGVLADVEYRKRLTSGLYSIHGYGIYQLDPGATHSNEALRGGVRTKGNFEIDPQWSWGWDGTVASDEDFLRDYSLDKRELASNNIYLTGISDRNYVSAQLYNFMSLGEYDQGQLPNAFPSLQTNFTFDQPVLGGELGIDTNTYALQRDESVDLTMDPHPTDVMLGTEQARSVTTVHWRKQMVGGMGTVITPFANLRSVITYSNDVGGNGEQDFSGDILPWGGVDMRWPLIAGYASGSGILSPVMQFIAAPDAPSTDKYGNENSIGFNLDTSNIFLDNRATGTDRFEGGTRVNAGLTYNYYGNSGWSAGASFGESFQIAGDNGFTAGSGLSGPQSDLVAGLQLQPWDFLTLRYEARAEEDLSQLNSQLVTAGLTFDRFSSSLSYADIAKAPDYGRPDHEEQVWGEARYQLADAWSMFGGLRYDVLNGKFVQKKLGVAFDCDCMNASLTYTEGYGSDPDYPDTTNRSLSLSVTFRTLGTFKAGL